MSSEQRITLICLGCGCEVQASTGWDNPWSWCRTCTEHYWTTQVEPRTPAPAPPEKDQ